MNGPLEALPFCGMLTDQQAAALLRAASLEEREPGPLLPPHSRTDAFCFLIEGRWRVERAVAGVDALMFEADRPGSWTGGIPLIDAIAPVSPFVLAPSRFLRVPIPALTELVASNPSVARWLLEGLEWGSRHIGELLERVPRAPNG